MSRFTPSFEGERAKNLLFVTFTDWVPSSRAGWNATSWKPRALEVSFGSPFRCRFAETDLRPLAQTVMAKKVGAKIVGLPNYVVIHGKAFVLPLLFSLALLTLFLAMQQTTASSPSLSLHLPPVQKYKVINQQCLQILITMF